MMKSLLMVSAVAMLVATSTAALEAAPLFRITEAYNGISGPDGSEDWIEVTNFGSTGDTSTIFYDDESLDITAGGDLPSFILGKGESAIFLVGIDSPADFPAAVTEFLTTWGPVANVGATGGGGLGGSGDTAALLDSMGNVINSLSYDSSLADMSGLSTFNRPSGQGVPTISMLGANGAYLSAAFENENGPGGMVQLIGSPGSVPEPTSALLFTLAVAGSSVAVGRRR